MNRCFEHNHGYITKFNSGKVNSTKFFHPQGGKGTNIVVDVPTIKMSKCFDKCGTTVYTDYIAAMVRYTDQSMLVILDGHMLDIKAMFHLEKEWVSTHKMFHYQNIVWNIGESGDQWDLNKYRLFAGLTQTYRSDYKGQPDGQRYYRVRSYATGRRPREARSNHENFRFGVTAMLWHQ